MNTLKFTKTELQILQMLVERALGDRYLADDLDYYMESHDVYGASADLNTIHAYLKKHLMSAV